MRVFYRLVIFIGLLLLLLSCRIEEQKTYFAIRGVMDLTGQTLPGEVEPWEFEEDGVISLEGEWEFYWNELLEPEDFHPVNNDDGDAIQQNTNPIYVSVPHQWKEVTIDGVDIKTQGFATYRLIIIPNETNHFGLRFPVENLDYRLWINGELVGKFISGLQKDLGNLEKTIYYYFSPETTEIEIIWQIRNNIMPSGGIKKIPYLGTKSQIETREKFLLFFEIILIGSLIIIAFFNLTLFFMRKKEAGSLIFALFALVMMSTVLLSGEGLITSMITHLDRIVLLRIVIIQLFIATSLFFHFIHYLFYEDSSLIHIVIVDSIALILTIMVLIVPDKWVPYMGYSSAIFIILSVGLVLTIIKALRHHRTGVYLIIIGSVCFFAAAFNDYLNMIGMLETFELTWVGLFVLVLFQSIMLAQRFTQSLNKSESLTHELETKNKALNNLTDQLENKVEERTRELREAMENLKTIQNQIIVQEKLASLGKLTAGIAHEIKNPLNFVNNFSLISIELIQELQDDLKKIYDNLSADIRENVEDNFMLLKTNIEKINEHGKRADSIVKAMLMHSREKSGERTTVDIKELLEEYINLSYHGIRAIDSSFVVSIESDFDVDLPPLSVYQQDLGRVFMNLFNNSFYALNEKRAHKLDETGDYIPILKVSVFQSGKMVEIRVRDNGTGIPEEIKNKIFNPFFTTKPAGQGTGLGLSLTHDIIVQEHQGEINILTEIGEFTEFIIHLPLKVSGK